MNRGCNKEQKPGIPIDAIAKTGHYICRIKFRHGHGVNITFSTTVKITCGLMMLGVLLCPIFDGSVGNNTNEITQEIVLPTKRQIGAMATIMANHKQTQVHASSKDADRKRYAVMNRQ